MSAMVMQDSLENHFLIAMPSLEDPFFARRVVYICEHNEEGAMGLVINHPLELTLEELLKQAELVSGGDSALDTPVYLGGPVSPERGFVLHTPQASWASSLRLTPDLMITTSRDILEAMGTDAEPDDYLILLGYSGWSAEQLEDEIKENSWLVIPADSHLLFDTPCDDRWHKAAECLGIDIRMLGSEAGHA